MPQVEGWRKVLIDGEGGDTFLSDVHSTFGCIGCHGGQAGKNTKEVAHQGLIADPSDGPDNTCTETCHQDSHGQYADAIHATQDGYVRLFSERSGGLTIAGNPAFLAGFQKDCGGCHVSCGDCHISSPKNVGGGLVNAHRVNRTPDMVKNCTACHGSRIGDEFYGNNDYAGADVHRVPNFMDCMDCHSGAEMHGDGSRPQHRYEVADMVRCTDCHDDVAGANRYHNVHWGEMSCQVCHSQTYKGCSGCHVGEGITGSSYPIFKIGRNPRPQDRDEPYQLLRHVPVVPDTYEGWGLDNLDDFSVEPTWKLTTPHNIRRWTERTQVEEGGSCGSVCHASQEWFLRAADLQGTSEAEREANLPYIVPDDPPTSWGDR